MIRWLNIYNLYIINILNKLLCVAAYVLEKKSIAVTLSYVTSHLPV